MMFYPGRYLRHNDKCELPEQIVFVDTETIPDCRNPDAASLDVPQKFRIGVAVGYRRKGNRWTAEDWLTFRKPEVFWYWTQRWCRKKSPCWVFAHNWDFDSQVTGLWGLIDAGWFKLTLPAREPYIGTKGKLVTPKPWQGMLVTEGRPWIAIGVSPGGTLKLVDTLNYFSMSLAKMGHALGIPKLARPSFSEPDDAWELYCKRDVEIISHAMRELMLRWKADDCGNWQMTAARLAKTNFQHKHGADQILIHLKRRVKRLERKGYCGGENRIWWRGFYGKPVHQVDCNGCYPHQMLTQSIPIRLVYWEPNNRRNATWQDRYASQSIAECDVDTFEDHYPSRSERNTSYPRGQFRTVLCGPELAYGILTGAVHRVRRYAYYEVAPAFASFARHWTDERNRCRARNDPIGEHLAKLMNVSLHGKFAALKNKWKMATVLGDYDRWGYFIRPDPITGKFVEHRSIAGSVQRRNGREERDDTFVAIAAFITAGARAHIRSVRESLPANTVLAQKSDALLLTDEGYEAMMLSEHWGSDEPGSFKHVESYRYVDIRSCNEWLTDKGHKLAGTPGLRVQVGPNTWRAYNLVNCDNVIGTGPQRRIEWKGRDIDIRHTTDEFGELTGAWLDHELTSPLLMPKMTTPISSKGRQAGAATGDVDPALSCAARERINERL